MDTLFMIVGLLIGVLQIVMIVKFFQIAADVRAIKNNENEKGVQELTSISPDFEKRFYAAYVSGDDKAAKDLLFDEISRSKEFACLLRGGNDTYFNQNVEEIRKRYSKYLIQINGSDEINFEPLKK
jgi:hypothetical protein